jgi:hypothetical protein
VGERRRRRGLIFAPGGQPLVVFDFVVENGRIIEISLIADARSGKLQIGSPLL